MLRKYEKLPMSILLYTVIDHVEITIDVNWWWQLSSAETRGKRLLLVLGGMVHGCTRDWGKDVFQNDPTY